MDTPPRTSCTCEVSDDEWTFLAPYLPLMREDEPRRQRALYELFTVRRYAAALGLAGGLLITTPVVLLAPALRRREAA